ncbi:MAG: carbohydrate deacetylase [Desulfatiglandales bacterium]
MINADDFGISGNINQGILEAARAGKINAISLISCGRFFLNHLDQLKATGKDLGIHLTITQETPVTEPESVPSIVDGSGRFLSMEGFLKRYFQGKVDPMHVYVEWKNQILQLLRHGIPPTHMNSHQHLHILPKTLMVAKRLKREFGIRYMRFEPLEPWRLFFRIPKKLPFLLTKAMATLMKVLIIPSETDHPFIGVGFSGGRLDLRALKEVLTNMRSLSFFELNIHPGFNTGAGVDTYLHWRFDWESDLRLIFHESFHGLLAEFHLTPCGFQGL